MIKRTAVGAGVTAALVGTKTEKHIDENLAIARLP